MDGAMSISKGVKVVLASGGAFLDVVACSERLAICEWDEGGQKKQDVFEKHLLRAVLVEPLQPGDTGGKFPAQVGGLVAHSGQPTNVADT